MPWKHNRRVVVGTDPAGRSVVVADAEDLARKELPTGIVLQDVWWQPRVPARPDDNGRRTGDVGLAPPSGGVVVRILTVPPSTQAPDEWEPDLHFDDALHVITQTEGELDIVLEEGTVTLRPGDTVILPASVHDLHNRTSEPATFVYTSVPLVR